MLSVIAAVIAALALTALSAWYFLVPQKMPLNTFNVADAEFGKIDDRGRVSATKDGKNLSEWMFGAMQLECKSWA